jgi:hypothetical protein
MRILSRISGQRPAGLPSWAAIDAEALRLAAALEQVHRHGNLDDFPETQSGKLALMATATRRGLLTWNRNASRYELTGLGRQHLGIHLEHPNRTLTAPASPTSIKLESPFSPRALMASAACVVVGVAVMAATLRSFDVEPQHLAALPDKTAPRQDNAPARTETPVRPDPLAASAPTSGRTEQPEASLPTAPGTPAGPAPETTAAGVGFASSQPPANSQDRTSAISTDTASEARVLKQTTPTPRDTSGQVEATAPVPHPDPRRLDAASAAIEAPKRVTTNEHRAVPEIGRTSKSQQVVQHPSRAEVGAHDKPNASPAAHGWASGKTVEVSRKGLLVREERTLRDGTVLVRYQYSNGPAHFETRPKGGRIRAAGYALAGAHLTPFGRFDWLR